MKRVLMFLHCILLIFVLLGCKKTPAVSIQPVDHNDRTRLEDSYPDIEISLVGLQDNVLYYQMANRSDTVFEYSPHSTLEMECDNQWYELEKVQSINGIKVVETDILTSLKPRDEKQIGIDLSDYDAKTLASGGYRVVFIGGWESEPPQVVYYEFSLMPE